MARFDLEVDTSFVGGEEVGADTCAGAVGTAVAALVGVDVIAVEPDATLALDFGTNIRTLSRVISSEAVAEPSPNEDGVV